MSIRFSHSSFPCTPQQKSDTGLPWGCLIQPLAPLPSAATVHTKSNEVERCGTCFAYINPYVTYVRAGWKCSLCRAVNSFTKTSRYSHQEDRVRLPELNQSDLEYVWIEEVEESDPAQQKSPQDDEDEADSLAAIESFRRARDVTSDGYDPSATLSKPFNPATSASLSPPAYLFLVDLSGDYNYVELIKASLLAAIEALSPSVWVGLATVSGKVGLYDLRCSTPSVSYVPIRSSFSASRFGPSLDEAPTLLPLASLLPPDSFLQQLEHCKEHLASAIESLASQKIKEDLTTMMEENIQTEQEPDYEAGGAIASPDVENESTPLVNKQQQPKPKKKPSLPQVSPCGFGAALAAFLQYFSSLSQSGFELNLRILSFLSQRPNYGLGALADRYSGIDEHTGEKVELNRDDFDRFLFQPSEDQMARSGMNTTTSANDTHSNHTVSSVSASQFYQSLGSECSQRGICLDLYILATKGEYQFFDLATMKFLSVLTGGNMIFYAQGIKDCTLPQDLFRQLRLAQGFRCMLRIRTSPEIHAANVYGHLVASAEVENLFHVGGCDARKVVAVDWEFCGSEGFKGGYVDVSPVIQVAFTYIGVRVVDGGEKVEHRLRILTRQMPLVHFFEARPEGTKEQRERMRRESHIQSLTELYHASNPEIILTLLVHQLIHASLERGVLASRELLKDWLVQFLVRYHKTFGITSVSRAAKSVEEQKDDGTTVRSPPSPLSSDSLDLSLSRATTLSFLPRFLFALLKAHPLLSSDLHVATPDQRVYLQCLFSGLEAEYVVKSIYPTLTSFSHDFSGVDTSLTVQQQQQQVRVAMHHPVLYLTRHSLSGCGDNIFVLDTYRTLYVLHTGPAASSPLLPLPPLSQSEVSKMLKRVKSTTPYLTPKVLCCAEHSSTGPVVPGYNAPVLASPTTTKDATLRAFLAFMLEDEDAAQNGVSYQHFLSQVGAEVAQILNGEE